MNRLGTQKTTTDGVSPYTKAMTHENMIKRAALHQCPFETDGWKVGDEVWKLVLEALKSVGNYFTAV